MLGLRDRSRAGEGRPRWRPAGPAWCKASHARPHPRCAPQEIEDDLPLNDYYAYFVPDWKLHLQPNPSVDNLNSRSYLEQVKAQVLENLRSLDGAPAVQMAQMPPSLFGDDKDEDDEDADTRHDAHAHGANAFNDDRDR